ncbi:MAG: BTAD domain-containing putative transcriptional regulator [Oscillospiraceae bacterium]
MILAVEDQKNSSIIYVRFFGNFQMEIGDVCITEKDLRSRRPWTLLQYLMVNRHKGPNRQKVIDVLWPEEASGQPENALKNLVYRMRTYFSKIDELRRIEIIRNTSTGYALNNNLPWHFDFEEFDQLIKDSADPYKARGEKIRMLQKAAGLFKGDFLANHQYEDWVFPFYSRYRIQYIGCVEQLALLLAEEGRNEEIEKVCHEAILVDPYQERVHIIYMRALVNQEKNTMAIQHYEKTSDLFFRELGVRLGKEIRELYNKAMRAEKLPQPDLEMLKKSWKEEKQETAFLCDIDTFRNIYRLEARSAERTGRGVFIVLMTISLGKGLDDSGDELKEAMNLLEKELFYGLRRGDVLARGGNSQYLLLLSTENEKNCNMVVRRLTGNFKSRCKKGVFLEAKLQPIEARV